MESYYSLRIQIKSSYDLLMLKIRLLHHHVKHHTRFISLNSALRPSSDSVLHMSPIECTDDKNPLFSFISIRFGSYEVRRLKLAVVGVEDSADVKQQSTKGQENEKKNDKNDTFAERFSFVICAVSSTLRKNLELLY